MAKTKPIFYHALMLTAVNLLLRAVSTGFHVYLSRRIGAEGIGLVQLVLSVTALAMTAGIAGIRTGTMYLCAEELGRKRPGSIPYVLRGCFRYALICGSGIALLLYYFAPKISLHWIGDSRTAQALRVFACFLPISCLTGVLSGYFTASARIPALSAAQIAEHLCEMAVTVLLLGFYVSGSPSQAASAVLAGSGAGCCITLIILSLLSRREPAKVGTPIPVTRRILSAALPLALADDLKSLISALENLMVPKRLALYPGITSPLGQFGAVCGMVFPVIFFPAAILFGLCELLIPELARCHAAGSNTRIGYLTRRSLRVTLLYGLTIGGSVFLLSDYLCQTLYKSTEAAGYLRSFSLLIPMLYCDLVTDAMIKGLGQQKTCVRYNIITSCMDVVFLYLLLPKYGMAGYYCSYLVTHLINFVLSLRALLRLTGHKIQLSMPVFALSDVLGAVLISSFFPNLPMKYLAYAVSLCSLYFLTGIVSREDCRWVSGLMKVPVR